MIRRTIICLLLSCVVFHTAFADPITYRQLRLGQSSRFNGVLNSPTAARQDPIQAPTDLAANRVNPPRAPESPNHPEFVRLTDGRLVKYGPGVICDENCVEALSLGRSQSPVTLDILPPLLFAGIVCAVLCTGFGSSSFAAASPVVIQPPVLQQPTPTPPAEVPEPGTLVLLGLGLGALLARKRLGLGIRG